MDILTLWLRSFFRTLCVGLKSGFQVLGFRLQVRWISRVSYSRAPSPYRVSPASRGFSLIELMVVTGIFVLLSTVVLSANSKFGNVVVLQSLAHEIALSIREAQVYGIAVRRFSGIDFDVPYGMRFKLPAANSPSTYELFGDTNTNGYVDNDDGILETTTISGGYQIASLYARNRNGGEESVEEIAVVFRRPEPDACISVGNTNPTFDSNQKCTLSAFDRVRVVLRSRSGTQVQIIVESSGQISVEAL